jgi:hypothetical protein
MAPNVGKTQEMCGLRDVKEEDICRNNDLGEVQNCLYYEIYSPVSS